MRSAVGNPNDDSAGVVMAEQVEELVAVATVTEVKVDKVPILELLLSLAHAHGRTSRQLRQTADHPKTGR